MNAVLGSIIENLRSIEITYSPTIEIFKGDRTNTGDAKEYSVNDFIASYLTQDYEVKKGKIYSLTGESKNIDCVVLAPNHPKLITPVRNVILAEGVFCAIEVKPDIKTLSESSEFYRGLKQIKSIKNLERTVDRVHFNILRKKEPLPSYFDKIPAVIFSKECAEIPKIIEFIRAKVENNKLGKEELPDLIFSIEKGLLLYFPYFKHTKMYRKLNPLQQKVLDKEVFMHVQAKEQYLNLLLFLKTILDFDTPHLKNSDFFIKNYLNQEHFGISTKFYPLNKNKIDDISPEVLLELIKDTTKNDEEAT